MCSLTLKMKSRETFDDASKYCLWHSCEIKFTNKENSNVAIKYPANATYCKCEKECRGFSSPLPHSFASPRQEFSAKNGGLLKFTCVSISFTLK
jgi:hypothetical protein